MSRKLVTFVHVGGQVYGPDSDVPADVAKQIDNPKAWGEDESSDKPAPAKKTAAKKASSSKSDN